MNNTGNRMRRLLFLIKPIGLINPLLFFALILIITAISSTNSVAQNEKQLVRLALIEVDTAQVAAYNLLLTEEIEASIKKEPGVLTLYAIAEKEHPERVTLFETYADSARYRAHLSTEHFQKYKQGTAQMVKHLELIEMRKILYIRQRELSEVGSQKDLFVRLIQIDLASVKTESFIDLAQRVMFPGLKKECGVLVMYAVAAKNMPTQVNILEVYRNFAAYEEHSKTPHFIEYKQKSTPMIRSIKIIEATPIALGSKPQN